MSRDCKAGSADAILWALADQHRRLALRQIKNASDGVASYNDVADYIVQHSSEIDEPEVARVRLHHKILPILADADLIEYDSRSEIIRYQPLILAEDVLGCIYE